MKMTITSNNVCLKNVNGPEFQMFWASLTNNLTKELKRYIPYRKIIYTINLINQR